MGFSLWQLLFLRNMGSKASVVVAPGLQSTGSVVVAHGLSWLLACGIFPGQGSNPRLLYWQVDSLPLGYQGNPKDLFLLKYLWYCVQLSSVAQSCLTLCDSMNRSTPGFPVLHHLLELAQTHVHWVLDAIQPSHSLPSPSPLALNLSQHQGHFWWVSSSHQVAKVLELHQSFQWIFTVHFL